MHEDFIPELKKHSRRHREVAVDVMSTSKQVVNWAVSEARFLGIDLRTESGKAWFHDVCHKRALQQVRQAKP